MGKSKSEEKDINDNQVKVKNNDSNNNSSYITLIVLLSILLLVTSGYIVYDKVCSKNKVEEEQEVVNYNDQNEEETNKEITPVDVESNTQNESNDNTTKANTFILKSNYTVPSNVNEKTANVEYVNWKPFVSIGANEIYSYHRVAETITIENGYPVINYRGNKVQSSIGNVKKLFVAYADEYHTHYVLLCDDGSVYIGKNLTRFNDDYNGNNYDKEIVNIDEFNKVEKVISSKKYNDIKMVGLYWETDDSQIIGFVLYAEDGTKDLVELL